MQTTDENINPAMMSDDELDQIFRDILKGPEERRKAFDRLQGLEAASGVERLPNSIQFKEKPKKNKEGKKHDSVLSASNLKRLFELYREHKEEIEQVLKVGGRLASTFVSFLLARKGVRLPPSE